MAKAKQGEKKSVAKRIQHLFPCEDAVAWSEKYTSPTLAWKECQQGDWMLWLIAKCSKKPASPTRKKLVLCATECARTALEYYESKYPEDDRVRKCLEAAEKWSRGEITIAELHSAANAAYAAAANAANAGAYAANAAADAAADAANAAYAAAYVAYAAADAAANAAYAAADAGARSKRLAACADIVRKHYPIPPKIRIPK